MDELRQRFATLNEIDVPDVWDEGSTRTPRTLEVEPILVRRPRQRLTAVVVAFVVFVAAGAFAWRVFERTSQVGPADPSVSTDPLGSIDVGWTVLPAPPAVLPGAADVWTGQELLVWGGSGTKSENDAPSVEGFAFDPSTRAWSDMPPAPIPGKFAEAVWTGTEAVFLAAGADASSWHGEAFNPATDTWRVIAPPPFESRPAVVIWTGTDIIGWGGGEPGEPSNVSGTSYDPVADAWSPIADAPVGMNAASGMWTGDEMLVFGSLLDGGNHAARLNAVGEIYDPDSDSWREMAPSDLSPQASAAVWLNDRMVAYDYGWDAAEYDVATGSWEQLEGLPFEDGECYPDGAVVGETVFAFGCGKAATWTPGERSWAPVTGGMTDATIRVNDRHYQLWRFASLIPSGGVLFLMAEGLTVSDQGVPCYGCPDSPSSFWAFRPT